MSKNDGPAASSFLDSSKTGWLTKHGGSGFKGNWKRRWFVLDHHYLFYYETAKDKHPKGIICLPDYKECRRAEKAECPKKHSFILIPDPDLVEPGTVARTYYIHGENEDECNDWVDAVLEEMRPTVGIQKQKDSRTKSLPDHSKTKITSSIKLNKKDLDVVTIAAASGGPQLTHLTKERAQAPKRRPPRKFKPMDEDDEPAMVSPISTTELQPSPSKKPAIDNKPTSSPVKKPVLPPSSSKQKIDVVGGINKEQGSPSTKVKGNPPVPLPGGINKEQGSLSTKVKGNPPAPPPKFYKELEHNGVGDDAKDTISPLLQESKDETMDTTDSSVPVPVLPLATSTVSSTEPKALNEEENKTSVANNNISPISSPTMPNSAIPLTKPNVLKEEDNKLVDDASNDSPTPPPATPTSNVSSTKPEPLEGVTKEQLDAPVTTNHPSTKPKPSNSAESSGAPVTSVATPSSADNKILTKAKVSDENNLPASSMAAPVTANRPFAKPKPPAKHPKPKNTPSKDRNLGLPVEETKDKVSTESHPAEKTNMPPGGSSAQVKTEEIKKTNKDHVETSLGAPTIKESTGKSIVEDENVTKEGKEKENIVMRESAIVTDKTNVTRPKPKPRMSKVDPIPKTPVSNPVLTSPSDTIKEITAGEDNEIIEHKADAEKPKEKENGISPAPIEIGGNVSNNTVDKDQVINEDKKVVTPSEDKAVIEDDNVDALYSVVELNRDGEFSHMESAQSAKERTPKHHDYDLVAISPRSLSNSPEQQVDPEYDVIGDVVNKESLSPRESIYDNWKLKKNPSGKAEGATDNGVGYAVVEHEVQNHPVTDVLPVPLVVPTSTVPEYARVHKSTKPKESDPVGSTSVDDDFDALCERLGSSIPLHIDQAKEMLRLAQVARQEAEQLKKEAAEDREIARRERMEAEQLKKNATEMLKIAKEKATS